MHWIISLVALLAVVGASPASAQAFPTKPIHILVPYPQGGMADMAARLIGAKMAESWGQQVVVENRPGDNGFVAMTAAVKAPPDGYTLVMATVGDLAVKPAMFKQIPYSVERDLVPVAQVSEAPIVLAANGNSPYKTVADVIAAAKAQPGQISVATPGNGTADRIMLEWVALNTGTKFRQVPFAGGAPAVAALVGGDVPLAVLAGSTIAPHAKRGRVRVLALTGAKPSKFNPEWPTMQKEGVPDIDDANWTALFAPKGTPQPIVDKLNAEVVKILNMPDIKNRLADAGVEAAPSTPAALEARVKTDAARFKSIVDKTNIKPD